MMVTLVRWLFAGVSRVLVLMHGVRRWLFIWWLKRTARRVLVWLFR